MENKTWSPQLGNYVKTPVGLEDFFNEIEEVCKKHNFSISHEDVHGAFLINKFTPENIEWLKDAHLDLES